MPLHCAELLYIKYIYIKKIKKLIIKKVSKCGLRVAYGNPQVCYLNSKVKTFNSKTRINSDVSAASQHYSKNTINFQLVYGF